MSSLPILRAAEQRFWSKADQSGECWLWTLKGCSKDGHPLFQTRWRGKAYNFVAHRAAYALTHGVFPSATEYVLRSCENKRCVRPEHLVIQTAEDRERLKIPPSVLVCLTCAEEKPIEEFHASGSSRYGVLRRCKPCVRTEMNDRHESMRQDTVTRMTLLMRNTRTRAREKGIAHDLTPDFLIALWEEQSGCCAVSGLPLLTTSDDSEFTHDPMLASLDRIDAREGYVQGNVRFVAFAVNVALREWGLDRVLPIMRALVERAA